MDFKNTAKRKAVVTYKAEITHTGCRISIDTYDEADLAVIVHMVTEYLENREAPPYRSV